MTGFEPGPSLGWYKSKSSDLAGKLFSCQIFTGNEVSAGTFGPFPRQAASKNVRASG
jgi:hypothetical protein